MRSLHTTRAWAAPTLLLVVCTFLCPPLAAQIVPTFTKDDCAPWSDPCGPPPPQEGEDCDGVAGPLLPQWPTRGAGRGANWIVQLEIVNGPDTVTGLQLIDNLPACLELDCSSLCVDSDCNGLPDTTGIQTVFSGGGVSDPPICDETNNRIQIDNIALGPDEKMNIRFCGTLPAPGMCCNRAWLYDGSGAQQGSVDWLGWALPGNPVDVCVEVGREFPFWKDDCGVRTTDPATGNPDPADCDDIGLNPEGQRAVVDQPAAGKRVKWVLHFDYGGTTRITDYMPDDMHVTCYPEQDPLDEGWGCFEIWEDGVRQEPPAFGNACMPGPGGWVDVNVTGQVVEVRVCARLTDEVKQLTCNNRATARQGMQRLAAFDNLDSDRDVCILAAPPQVEALKTVNTPGPYRPGDIIEYQIELCEISGTGDAIVDFTDPIPANIINAELDRRAPRNCRITPGTPDVVECPDTQLNADGDPCTDPLVIVWRGELTCDGLEDGDEVCNQGMVEITSPEDPNPVPTDDPTNPFSEIDRTCFPISLDSLDDSTKDWVISNDVNGDTLLTCGEDTLQYVIELVSNGGGDALQVVLDDVLPADATYVPGSTTLNGAPVLPDPYDPGTRTVTVQAGDIPTGTSATVRFDVTTADLGIDYQMSNQGTIASEDSRSCGFSVVTDYPGVPLRDDPTIVDVICVPPPPESDPVKDVVDMNGDPVTEVPAGQDFMYSITWCNDGGAPMTDVRFTDLLPRCVAYTGPTYLDGAPVTPDPYDPGSHSVIFDVDPSQDARECHTVEIVVRPIYDPSSCPIDGTVDNDATISCNEDSWASNDGNPATFTLRAPEWTLRRNAELISRDPLDPPKTPTAWGGIMDYVGSCDPARARLGFEDDMVMTSFPPTECVAGDGLPGGSDMIVFYELAGDCGFPLRVAKVDCDGDTLVDDVELDYQ